MLLNVSFAWSMNYSWRSPGFWPPKICNMVLFDISKSIGLYVSLYVSSMVKYLAFLFQLAVSWDGGVGVPH